MPGSGPGEFGRHLRELRESAALSQEELAERANLTAKAIGALERGERRRPYPNTIRALCDGLGLDESTARTLAGAVRTPVDAPGPARAAPSTIPIPPSPMVGRASELARVVDLLGEPATRIVTLTGTGGVGKTRLALEVARQLQERGREVVVVELAAIRQVDLVVPTIARTFGLQTGSDDLLGAIAGQLTERTPVLLLDNVEHLMGVAEDVAELVGRCPGVTVLATSRAPLRVRAEHEVPLDPLPVPTVAGDVDAVAGTDAVRVFTERARRVAPNFVVDRSNASAVAAICRRLDGLPLALELAAAHVQYLGPAQLLDRLDHAVDSARLRDLPERQRTMRATLDWSYELLTTDEREVLGALAVFAGGFDLEAAEHVASAPGRDVLGALEGLIEQSLVVGPDLADPFAAARFRMLEPVRDYASTLTSAEDATACADRHATYFIDLCRDAHDGLRGTDLQAWLDRLATEHANLRAALTTSFERCDLTLAARVGEDTWVYWALRGHAGEGVVWWQRVLDEDGGQLDDRARASAHLTLGGLALATGDLEAVREHAMPALAILREAGDDLPRAEALFLASSYATFTGELATAAELVDELAGVVERVDGPWARTYARIASAQLSLMQGDLDGCRAGLDDAEALARSGAGPFALGTTLNMRSTVAFLAGDDDAALRAATEAVEIAADVGTTWTLVYTLPALATQAARRGRPDLAATLFAAATATAEASLLAVAFRPDLEAAEAHLGDVRARLTDAEFDRAWTRGRALRVDDVVALIPEVSGSPAPS